VGLPQQRRGLIMDSKKLRLIIIAIAAVLVLAIVLTCVLLIGGKDDLPDNPEINAGDGDKDNGTDGDGTPIGCLHEFVSNI
jgi:hypothetical protein